MAHYPWEFSLNELTISDSEKGIVVSTPNSLEIGVTYLFKHKATKAEFFEWFEKHHSDKFRFMHNFTELRA